jgi:hypothetical protein
MSKDENEITDDEIVERAIKKYLKDDKQKGFRETIETQPNSNDSYVDDNNIVHLLNVHGELAKYQYYPKTNRLKQID